MTTAGAQARIERAVAVRAATVCWRLMSAEDRFWCRVRIDGDCWVWQGEPLNRYGSIRLNGSPRVVLAHRYAYELLRGPIPDGLTLDHLCRRTKCVNAWHLEPVTHYENVKRGISPHGLNAAKTHCKRGHPLDDTNIVWLKGRHGRPRRDCRPCITERRTHYESHIPMAERPVVGHEPCARCGRSFAIRRVKPSQRQHFCSRSCISSYAISVRWGRRNLAGLVGETGR